MMGERGAGPLLRAVAGWVLGWWLAGWGAVWAADGPSLPGVFPPLGPPADGSGEPADFLSFLRSLGESDPERAPAPALTLPRILPDLRDFEQTGPPRILSLDLPNVNSGPGGQADPFAPSNASAGSQGFWGTLTGSVVVTGDGTQSAWDLPAIMRTWQANQSWRCDVAGPLSAFGQVGGNSEEASQTDMRVNARTGLACKVSVPLLSEFVLRGGPGVSCTDPPRPDRTLAHSDWQFDLQARCPLMFGAGLEYQASALPAMTAQAQDQLNQDLRVAFPVSSAGKLKVGARHKWASTPDPRPWTDGMQLYLGLELAR